MVVLLYILLLLFIPCILGIIVVAPVFIKIFSPSKIISSFSPLISISVFEINEAIPLNTSTFSLLFSIL